MEPYTITRELHPEGQSVTLLLNGRFNEDALWELENTIAEVRGAHQHVVIDLSEVTLVDRKAAEYFSAQSIHDVKLINCPVYLVRWITKVSHEN